MSYETHSFSVELAKSIGLEESIILQHLYWWYQHNSYNPEMIRDGSVWVFRSVKEMRENFPYLSDGNIRTALKHLLEKGLIVRGDYSERSMNKSIWYSLTETALCLFVNRVNPFVDSTNGCIGFDESIDNRIDSRKDKDNYMARPSVEEVERYCRERGNRVDARKFVDYYTANGWKVGKNQMKDWKAAVRTWETREHSEKKYLSPEERTMNALSRLQNSGTLNTFPDEQ